MKELIIRLKEKSKANDYSMKGFEHMADVLQREKNESFDPKYLKYNLYEGKSKSAPRETKLDVIADYLGYKNYKEFVDSLNPDLILQSMVGDYYCYVRMNKGEGKILRSPVQVSLKEGQVHYCQKGGRLNYQGEITQREGCLFILMNSDEGKTFHHIYRIGKRPSPEVLQGVFSGVSTNFEPIGGRTVLWRSSSPFDSLRTGKLDILTLQKSEQKDEQILAAYFQHEESNNLSIKKPYTFGPEDLE